MGRKGGIGRMGRIGRTGWIGGTAPVDKTGLKFWRRGEAEPSARPSRPAYPARPAIPARSAIAAFCLLAAACSSPAPPATQDYAAKVASDRSVKDSQFQTASDSPIPPERRSEFLPLAYFPIDPDYDVPARLKPIDDRTAIDMPTSTGTQRKMRRVGTLEFSIKGQPLKLTAFVEADTRDLSRLFVPFNDLTSGADTYPGGRYMDLDRTATDIYEVDFNRAYHPYCYYNPTYECPFPPPENRLKIPVRAGERLKQPST